MTGRATRFGPSASPVTDGFAALATALWGAEMRPPQWQSQAACKDSDTAHFDGGQGRTRWAQAVCASCPVRQMCAEDQLRWERRRGGRRVSPKEIATVRGGLSATTRAEMHQTTTTTTDQNVA